MNGKNILSNWNKWKIIRMSFHIQQLKILFKICQNKLNGNQV